MGPGATHVYVAQTKGIVTTLVAHLVAQSAASTSHTLFMFNRVQCSFCPSALTNQAKNLESELHNKEDATEKLRKEYEDKLV